MYRIESQNHLVGKDVLRSSSATVNNYVRSLTWDATLVILAFHGGLHSSPTQDSKRTDVVLASRIFPDHRRITNSALFHLPRLM